MRQPEGGSEYYIVRVYRRQTGRGASKVVGLVEDKAGTRRAFHDFRELVQVLTEALESGAIRRIEGEAAQSPDRV